MEEIASSLTDTLVPFLIGVFIVLLVITIVLALLPIPKIMKKIIGTFALLGSTYWLFNEFILKASQLGGAFICG